ncbi:MAG: hypothetical protein Q8R30_03615 [bacterium]|nr:hypothetical protein [bacterium]
MKIATKILMFAGLMLLVTAAYAYANRNHGSYPCGGANGPCGVPSHHHSGYYPCGGANGPCGTGVVVTAPPPQIVVRPTPVIVHRVRPVIIFQSSPVVVTESAPIIVTPLPSTIVEDSPVYRSPQPVPSDQLQQSYPTINFDMNALRRRKIVHNDHFGKPPYPTDLIPGAAVMVCNAPSGSYKLYSESTYRGTQQFKQQCWVYQNPLGGVPLEQEVPGD